MGAVEYCKELLKDNLQQQKAEEEEEEREEWPENGEDYTPTQYKCISDYTIQSLKTSNTTNTALASTLGPMGGAGVTAACIFGKSIIGTIKSLIS